MYTFLRYLKYSLIGLLSLLLLFICIVAASYLFSSPSNSRSWEESRAILPSVKEHGTHYSIENLRDWRYNDNFTIASRDYRTIDFDLDDLQDIWFLVEPFGDKGIVAHTMISFEFKDGNAYVMSVEARREVNETYSSLKGIFPVYEYMYVWSTEHDAYTNAAIFSGHDGLLMYKLEVPQEAKKHFLVESLKRTKDIETKPRFYNSITSSCTTALVKIANAAEPGSLTFHYAWFLPGFADDYLYKLEYFDTSLSFEQLQHVADIEQDAVELKEEENFSSELRKRLQMRYDSVQDEI